MKRFDPDLNHPQKGIDYDAVYYHFRKWSRDGRLKRCGKAAL